MSIELTQEGGNISTLADVLAYCISHREKDFYARFISSLPTREQRGTVSFGEGTEQQFMMGVSFEKGHHVFLYNPDFVAEKLAKGKKGFNELKAVIAHEAEHVILAHIARTMKVYRQLTSEDDKELFLKSTNFAADAAVNDLLVRERNESGSPLYPGIEDPENHWVLPKNIGLPDELTYEWYVSLLMDPKLCLPHCKDQKCNGNCRPAKNGKGNVKGGHTDQCKGHQGAHGDWVKAMEEMNDEETEVLMQQIEQDAYQKLRDVTEEHRRSRGTVPGHIEQRLAEMLKPPQIPWKKLMHQFVTRCRMSKPVRSMERPRKRWLNLGSTIYPGQKRDRTFKLAFCIDTSGSMSTEDLMEGLEELQGLQSIDKDTEVTVIEFDTMIHKEYVLKSSGKIDVELRGRGGTDFNAAFNRTTDLQKQGKVDAIIIFTDGYAPPPEGIASMPRSIPILWCLTEGGKHPCEGYGFEIRRPKR